jgi:hypothetical protein
MPKQVYLSPPSNLNNGIAVAARFATVAQSVSSRALPFNVIFNQAAKSWTI